MKTQLEICYKLQLIKFCRLLYIYQEQERIYNTIKNNVLLFC